MGYRFEKRKSKDGQHFWAFVGSNGEDMCCSETMKNEADVDSAIDTLRREASSAPIVTKKSNNGKVK